MPIFDMDWELQFDQNSASAGAYEGSASVDLNPTGGPSVTSGEPNDIDLTIVLTEIEEQSDMPASETSEPVFTFETTGDEFVYVVSGSVGTESQETSSVAAGTPSEERGPKQEPVFEWVISRETPAQARKIATLAYNEQFITHLG
ncbi:MULTISPECIES: hypothetical protein [unclassified Roseovarius]|uniref:hypothetical protein n=1 Tax=unclassified Roseovarius TaxID=2614913 RepID=UPI00273E522D|nr:MULTISPECIES: hypothetical protein [unclassified Roseovarius]